MIDQVLPARIFLLSGDPAIGKSTALSKILLEVRTAGFAPGGVLTREIRSHGEREGFQLIDIASDQSEKLADVKGITGPRIGKYRVNLKALSTIGVEALRHAALRSDLVAVDEVGPMELLSPEFRKAIRSAVLESVKKPSVCVVHKRFQDPLIEELRGSTEAIEHEITFENRSELPQEVTKDIIRYLRSEKSDGGKAR
jgi:nucleoside-triphosphatase